MSFKGHLNAIKFTLKYGLISPEFRLNLPLYKA